MNHIFSRATTIRRQARIFLAVSLVLVCLLGVLSMPAVSASGTTAVTLTVQQNLITNVPGAPNRAFTYRLVPLESTNPMPTGSRTDGYIFSANGTEGVQIGPITFTALGVYSYELSVVPDTESESRYIYDTRVYRIDIHVMNDTPDNLSASNLTAMVLVFEGREAVSGNKVGEILFEHRYEADTTEPEMITISGTKTWEHGSNPADQRPESITVHVMDGERTAASAIITEADHWMWEFRLPGTRADGSEIIYTLTEDPVEGYEMRITGFNITNIHESVGRQDDYITLGGQKTWDFGSDPVNQRPGSITVLVKNGDTVVERVTITANDNWRWTATVPRTDANGNTINYTIGEENVPRYTLTVNGFDLHNRFVHADFPGDNPKTGDGRNILFWSAVAAVSAIGFMGLMFIVLKKKTKKEEIEIAS